MANHRRIGHLWGAALVAIVLVGAACATPEDDESVEVAGDVNDAETDESTEAAPSADLRRTLPAGLGDGHDNVQPSLALKCIISLEGVFPSRADSLRRGVSSSAGSGAPAVATFNEPYLGEISWVAFDFVPRGWARCDGQLLGVNEQTALFALLGTIYGGNGVTTFALPDVRGRAIVHEGQGVGLTERSLGSTFGTEREVANLGAHGHSFESTAFPSPACAARDEGSEPELCTDQQLGTARSGVDHNNMQPSIVLNCIISTSGPIAQTLRRQTGEEYLGEIKWVPYPFAPIGWEFCDGQLKDISTNASLFSVLGTRYGGDGTSTFALPDARGRTFVHAGRGPDVTERSLGSMFGTETVGVTADQLPVHDHLWAEDAESATSSAGGGWPHENVQPSLALHCIMSYEGIYPSRSMRRAVASSTARAEPAARVSTFSAVGQVSWIAFNYPPAGWVLCDGLSFEISNFEPLFSLIGTTYGGDGTRTFQIPEVRGRTTVHHGNGPGLTSRPIGESVGSETVALTIAEMPSHTHTCPGGPPTDALVIAAGTGDDKELRCADLAGATLTTLGFVGANLSEADLSGAEMYATDLAGATAKGARLIGTELTEANLAGADLTGADLTGAMMFNTDMTGANLTGANLTDAALGTAIWSNTTCPDGSNSDTNGRNACP